MPLLLSSLMKKMKSFSQSEKSQEKYLQDMNIAQEGAAISNTVILEKKSYAKAYVEGYYKHI